MKYLKKYNESKTPREQIKDWEKLNGDDGYYGTYNSRIISLESSLKNKALKIMSKLNQGFLSPTTKPNGPTSPGARA